MACRLHGSLPIQQATRLAVRNMAVAAPEKDWGLCFRLPLPTR